MRLQAIDSVLICSSVFISVSVWSLLTVVHRLASACFSREGSMAARTTSPLEVDGTLSLVTYMPGLSLLSSRLLTLSSATTPTTSQGISGPSCVLPGTISCIRMRLPNGVFVGEIFPRHGFVDDGDGRRARDVVIAQRRGPCAVSSRARGNRTG